jgi:hypothetical protein
VCGGVCVWGGGDSGVRKRTLSLSSASSKSSEGGSER